MEMRGQLKGCLKHLVMNILKKNEIIIRENKYSNSRVLNKLSNKYSNIKIFYNKENMVLVKP